MIVSDLICSDGHRFESWFRSGAAYEDQSEHKAIVCPVCGDTAVGKAPMRLFVSRRGEHDRDRAGSPDPEAATAAGSPSASSPPASPSPPSRAAPSDQPASQPTPASVPSAAEETLQALRKLIEATCDDVGREFAEEARRIHYGETDPRNIYGKASADEADALREEGIAVQSLPWMRRRLD
jgi:hypothetical protein